jgi:hypothetical protein
MDEGWTMPRLAEAAHTEQRWRIHEFTSDFSLEDMWSFRTPGAGPDDFPAMLAAMRAAGGPGQQPGLVRFLFAVRERLGALLGWDDPSVGVGARVASLRDRLPSDIRDAPRGLDDEHSLVSGVLTVDNPAPGTWTKKSPTLWLSPRAGSFPAPVLPTWSTARLVGNQVDHRPAAAAPRTALGLAQDWPVGDPFPRAPAAVDDTAGGTGN